ncbi:3'-5' exonuclease [Pseudomonas sp. USHLN015]|uniref:3'-5' exonuclease n=1 Tax=Pseudomonas sp. USHLN015 TaxID=3081296 RepID=UPI00301E2D96
MTLYTFDTETNGLPDWKAPSEAPHQPHIVDIAACLYTPEGQLLDSFEALIRPDGWTIPDEVAAIHGITTERAMDEGIPEAEALEQFLAFHRRAEMRVAHNLSFDDRILRIALKRFHGDEVAEAFKGGNSYCTMRKSTDIVRLPPTAAMRAAKRFHFKSPTLGETYQHFFKEELVGAHRAMTDTKACARIYFAIQGVTPPADAAPADALVPAQES